MDTLKQALTMLESEQVMTLVPLLGSRFRSLVAEVAGGPVKGSWWGHPKGKLIYRIAEELEASGAVLVCKLVRGKVTFVHRGLWPPLVRVVTDASWRAHVAGGLARDVRSLLERVEAEGRLRLDGRTSASKLLEAKHLVVVSSEHSEHGAHATVLRSWSAWATSAGAHAAEGSLAAAQALLAEAGIPLGDGVD